MSDLADFTFGRHRKISRLVQVSRSERRIGGPSSRFKFVLSARQCPITPVGGYSGSTGDHKLAKLAGLSFYELASVAMGGASHGFRGLPGQKVPSCPNARSHTPTRRFLSRPCAVSFSGDRKLIPILGHAQRPLLSLLTVAAGFFFGIHCQNLFAYEKDACRVSVVWHATR